MFTTRRTLLGASAAGLTLAAFGCAPPGASTGGNSELNAILDRISTQILHESPEFATALAVSEAQAGGRFMDRLSDASREGARRRRQLGETALADLQRLSRDTLSGQDAVTYDVV